MPTPKARRAVGGRRATPGPSESAKPGAQRRAWRRDTTLAQGVTGGGEGLKGHREQGRGRSHTREPCFMWDETLSTGQATAKPRPLQPSRGAFAAPATPWLGEPIHQILSVPPTSLGEGQNSAPTATVPPGDSRGPGSQQLCAGARKTRTRTHCSHANTCACIHTRVNTGLCSRAHACTQMHTCAHSQVSAHV